MKTKSADKPMSGKKVLDAIVRSMVWGNADPRLLVTRSGDGEKKEHRVFPSEFHLTFVDGDPTVVFTIIDEEENECGELEVYLADIFSIKTIDQDDEEEAIAA